MPEQAPRRLHRDDHLDTGKRRAAARRAGRAGHPGPGQPETAPHHGQPFEEILAARAIRKSCWLAAGSGPVTSPAQKAYDQKCRDRRPSRQASWRKPVHSIAERVPPSLVCLSPDAAAEIGLARPRPTATTCKAAKRPNLQRGRSARLNSRRTHRSAPSLRQTENQPRPPGGHLDVRLGRGNRWATSVICGPCGALPRPTLAPMPLEKAVFDALTQAKSLGSRVGLVQMCTGRDVEGNLREAGRADPPGGRKRRGLCADARGYDPDGDGARPPVCVGAP